MSTPVPASVRKAFSGEDGLEARVINFIRRNPQQLDLIEAIATYVSGLKSSTSANGHSTPPEEPTAKKRKLAHHDKDPPHNYISFDPSRRIFADSNTSFMAPQRQKLKLQFFRAEDFVSEGGIAAVNPRTGTTEFAVAWSAVDEIVCLPVPEKPQRQHAFIVFPKNDLLPPNLPPHECVVWSMPDAPAKTVEVGAEWAADAGVSYVDVTTKVLDAQLKRYGKKVVFADEAEFASQIPQVQRKGERAVHVKAFRGSKDGYLFFLPIGIVWAFKKPLALYPFDAIRAISYTAVLARTFNLCITTTAPPSSPTASKAASTTQEVEFSMVDQADFAGIDAYVKRHGLHDGSMAERRRAKALNADEAARASGEQGGDEAESELAKAERQLQDEEDDREEDYVPEGDGDGGESSGEDEEEGGEEGEGDVGDLVEDELGSEAEDVDEDGE